LSAGAVVINSEIDTLGNRESGWIALRLVQETPQQAVLLDKICRGGRASAHPTIAMAYGTLESRGLTRSEPDRRVVAFARVWVPWRRSGTARTCRTPAPGAASTALS